MNTDQQGDAGTCPVDHAPPPLADDATLLDPKILASPTDFYAALRANDPVRYDPQLDMYLVSRYDDLRNVLHDNEIFSLQQGYEEQFAKGLFGEYKQILIDEGGGFFTDEIMTDPPRHGRPRKLLEKVFNAHRVKELEPRIRRLAVAAIDRFLAKAEQDGTVDGVTDFAAPLTISVITEQLGFHDLDAATIHRWSLAATSVLGRMTDREAMLVDARHMCDLQHYLIARVHERQERRTEDLLSDLVYAEVEDDDRPRLEFDEIIALARALFVGGNDTTSSALSALLLTLATHPDIFATLRQSAEDDRKLTRFVEEFLRLEPPVRGLSRKTTREVELGGIKLPAGAHVLLLFASANDDAGQFACPRSFDLDRSNLGRHMSFGAGIHRCVGLSLARMEIKVVAQELARRVESLELAVRPDQLVYQPSIAIQTFKSLPLRSKRRA